MAEIYQTQQIEEEVLIDILCDKCGNSCRADSSFPGGLYEFAQFIARWGYGSRKDEEKWDYFLCENCADKVIEFVKGNMRDIIELGRCYCCTPGCNLDGCRCGVIS